MNLGMLITLLGGTLCLGALTNQGAKAATRHVVAEVARPDDDSRTRDPAPAAAPATVARDADPFAFGLYRGMHPEPMGEQTLINGARMRVASLLVEEPPQAVLEHYAKSLGEQGIVNLIPGQVEAAGLLYLSFRPPGSQELKTLTLVPHGSGTVILASIGNPEQLLAEQNVLPEGLPLPPNAQPPSAIQQLESGLASRSAFVVVNDSTPEAVRSFYRAHLLERGYVPASESDRLPGMDCYQRDGAMLSLTVEPHEDASAVAVSFMWLAPGETP